MTGERRFPLRLNHGSEAMKQNPAYDAPSTVYAIDGEVVLSGPDGVGLSMTPAAAAETARRLAEASKVAEQQTRPPDNGDD